MENQPVFRQISLQIPRIAYSVFRKLNALRNTQYAIHLLLFLVTLLLSSCAAIQSQLFTPKPDLVMEPEAPPTSGIVYVTMRHVAPGKNTENLDQNWELYLVQPDGSGETRLTNNEVVDTSPSWSPDGRQIAYRSRIDGSADIVIMDADGRNIRNLIKDPKDSIYDDFYPEWNPNPERPLLAIYTDRFYSPDVGCAWHRLAIMPVEGGIENIQVLEDPLTEQETLAWSPDGSKIVFSSRCDFGQEKDVDLLLLDIDTMEVTDLVEDGYINGAPAYAHNGRYLAYQSVREGAADIIILDLETGESVNITNNPEFKDSHPTWSPDDSQIAFVSNRDGNDEIYVMDVTLEPFASASNFRNISNHPSKDFEPAWSPIP